mgnify:CR=1 FL=1
MEYLDFSGDDEDMLERLKSPWLNIYPVVLESFEEDCPAGCIILIKSLLTTENKCVIHMD